MSYSEEQFSKAILKCGFKSDQSGVFHYNTMIEVNASPFEPCVEEAVIRCSLGQKRAQFTYTCKFIQIFCSKFSECALQDMLKNIDPDKNFCILKDKSASPNYCFYLLNDGTICYDIDGDCSEMTIKETISDYIKFIVLLDYTIYQAYRYLEERLQK